jgi:hypothetical protein
MRQRRRAALLLRLCVFGPVLATAIVVAAPRAQVAAPPQPQRPFQGREAEIEAFLKTAKVIKYENLKLGVTKPSRAWLEPGGPCASVAWKPLRPGIYSGYWESYRSEIAAYEVDKLLGLHMVPPTVERRLNGVRGAIVMWLDGMRMWKELESKPATAYWNTQLVRMMMFDAFIGNGDRNAGNILVDDNWTMYLIDHSRAFATRNRSQVKLAQVDASLWARMRALDEPALRETLGQWLDRSSIRGMIQRRERMQEQIDELVRQRGEASVYIR